MPVKRPSKWISAFDGNASDHWDKIINYENELDDDMDFEVPYPNGHFAFQQNDTASFLSIRKVEVPPLP